MKYEKNFAISKLKITRHKTAALKNCLDDIFVSRNYARYV